MANCCRCGKEGYDHVIDLQGQSYDLKDGEPIMRSFLDRTGERSLCISCADAMTEEGLEVRAFLYKRIEL